MISRAVGGGDEEEDHFSEGGVHGIILARRGRARVAGCVVVAQEVLARGNVRLDQGVRLLILFDEVAARRFAGRDVSTPMGKLFAPQVA